MLSQSLTECQEKVANTLQQQCKDLEPRDLDNLIVGINMEIIRAWKLGFDESQKQVQKERSDRAWEIDAWFNRQMGS